MKELADIISQFEGDLKTEKSAKASYIKRHQEVRKDRGNRDLSDTRERFLSGTDPDSGFILVGFEVGRGRDSFSKGLPRGGVSEG